jgi:carboxyl-terminal processing protease
VKASIKSEIFTSQFGQLEGLKVRAEWDPSINKALSFLPEAQTLEEHARVVVAQRNGVPSTTPQ